MTEKEIISTFAILLLAGSEATATLLSAATFYLLKNPSVMEKLKSEIWNSFKTEEEITQISANKLKYYLAVLDEALRIHPPTPSGLPRLVPEGGRVVDGQGFLDK